MRRTGVRSVVGAILVCLITVGLTSTVYARSVGAWAGNPIGISVPRGSCFSEFAGAVKGTFASGCNGSWEVNLPVDNSGSYTITFTAANNPGAAGAVSCQAYAVSPSGSFTNSSVVAASTTTLTTYSLPAVSVPSGGNLYIACFALANGTVGTIAW
jgi:hypothetical protein